MATRVVCGERTVVGDHLRLQDRHCSGPGMTVGCSPLPLLAAVMPIPLDEAIAWAQTGTRNTWPIATIAMVYVAVQAAVETGGE